ncbi:MAG: hypothetical protein ACT4O1_01330 [Gemmatimonadota bacterium]
MARMDPKLLYTTAQQMNPRRAGTPGRAPRNWRAVVEYRRPLRLFVYLGIAFIGLAAGPVDALAQNGFAGKPSVQIRLGAFAATPLVVDEVSHISVDTAFPAQRSNRITMRQAPGPIGTVAVRLPVRANAEVEVNASVGRSMVRGDDGLTTWDFTNAVVANGVVSLGYLYRRAIVLHLGFGVTKLLTEERGMFSDGNSIEALLEAGLSRAFVVSGREFDLDLRVQTHGYDAHAVSAGAGNVTRAILQAGTTLWKGQD